MKIFVSVENYVSDLQPLLKSFYPGEAVEIVKVSEGANVKVFMPTAQDEPIRLSCFDRLYEAMPDYSELNSIGSESTEKVAIRNGSKRLLYRALAEITGKQLPWGSLTGIRPTRIAMSRLLKGETEEAVAKMLSKDFFVSEEKIRLSLDIAKKEINLTSGRGYEDNYSLYIGIPFCPTTCLYCSFASNPVGKFKKLVEEYLDCLIKEINEMAGLFKGRTPDTIYIGGGTPTALTDVQLDRLLGCVAGRFDLSAVKEFTVEAGRPDSITSEKLLVLKKYGVSRISINPQTFKDETLKLIGRCHTVADTIEKFNLARELGFDNINMDIILGLPGEDMEDVKNTLAKAAELCPESLTVHSLAIKRASKLGEWLSKHPEIKLYNSQETVEICHKAAEKMQLNPYYLYRQKNMAGSLENTGYAKEGKESLYNILMMEEVQTIIACGAGTVTKRVYGDGRIERCDNVKDVALYISKIEEMIDRKRGLFKD